MPKLLTSIVLFIALVFPAFAVNPNEVLDDPVLEQRARELSVNIRCLVCQNQSIDDSDAQLAKDLRILVREKLVEGSTDQEILDFLVARYGEFVLLKPKFGAHTIILWILPFLGLVIAFFAVRSLFRKREVVENSTKLSADEQAELSRLLDKN